MLPKTEVRIVPAETFRDCAEEIRTDPRVPGAKILEALVEKVKELSQYDWHEPPPEKFYSAYRNGYTCRFHPEYVFTFERLEVKKSLFGPVEAIMLRLATIKRA